jgi:hypothetical protein
MSAAHIEIARGNREHNGRSGPKAAFEFYLGQSIPTAAATQSEIRSAGGKKAQFEAYCAKFGSQFGPVKAQGAVRSEEQRVEVVENGAIARIASRLGISAKKLAALVADEDTDDEVVEDEPIVATRISWPMCMTVKKIVEANGQTFKITGKTGGKGTGQLADYAVTVAGRKLTPAKASALIAADRA